MYKKRELVYIFVIAMYKHLAQSGVRNCVGSGLCKCRINHYQEAIMIYGLMDVFNILILNSNSNVRLKTFKRIFQN